MSLKDYFEYDFSNNLDFGSVSENEIEIDEEFEIINREIEENIDDIDKIYADIKVDMEFDNELYQYQLYHAEVKSNIIVTAAVMFWFLSIRVMTNYFNFLENSRIVEEYNNKSLMDVC